MVQVLSEDQFKQQVVSLYTDVVGEKIGGKVLSFSDEFFAEAANLIKPKPPIFDANKFVFTGKWFDGWETRRHNTEESDWVIIQFGVSGAKIIGTEVDTAYFTGNAAPEITVEAANIKEGESLEDAKWDIVIEKTECHPSQRHFFKRDSLTEKTYTHARLAQYPDGGIARFRLYGAVVPQFDGITTQSIIDLASVQYGGVAVKVSDQHFGSADNLLLPGRGVDMGDGWETKRSRGKDHTDWAIIKLGAKTKIHEIVVDTAHFRGNFPQKITLHGLTTSESIPSESDPNWVSIVEPTKTVADKEHSYKEFANGGEFTHVKLTMIPDGGVKRVRVFGSLAK